MKALVYLVALSFFTTAAVAHVAVDEMADAAAKFLGSLKPEQAAKASFKLKDDERQNWHFIPKARNGLPVKDMTEDQRKLAMKLLRAHTEKKR